MTTEDHRCFRCNKHIASSEHWIHDALYFQAHGNFGSRLFDPSPTEPECCIEIIVCDECAAAGKVLMKTERQLEQAREHQAEVFRHLRKDWSGVTTD